MILIPSDPREDVIDLLCHVECLQEDEDMIASRIEELGVCDEVIIVKIPDNRLALNVLFPYKIMGMRGAIVPEVLCSGFLIGMRKRLGEGGAKAFLYLIGIEVGKELYSFIKTVLGDLDLIQTLEIIFHIARALGISRLRSIRSQNSAIILELLDNLESAVLKRRYSSPQCHLTKGLLTGVLQESTKKRWEVNEVECIAMGSESCTFILERS